ncbi:hypothetical protein FWH30_00740 [Microgenomates group bacterium]|nr:hypothetical protein [Microgenomates group bacterium]
MAETKELDQLDELDEQDEFSDPYYNDPYGGLGDQEVEITLFSWYGPSHIRKQATRRYYLNLGLLILIIALILIFLNQFYMLMMLLAIAFLLIVLTIAEPQPTHHVITNYGVYTGRNFYPWESKGKYFWFEQDDKQTMVIIQTRKIPYQIVMLLNPRTNQGQLTDVLSNFLANSRPPRTVVDKFFVWWKKTFPLSP